MTRWDRHGRRKLLAVCGTQTEAFQVRDAMKLDPAEWWAVGEGSALCGAHFTHIIVIAPADRTSAVHQKGFEDWLNCSLRTRLDHDGVLEVYETNLFEPEQKFK